MRVKGKAFPPNSSVQFDAELDISRANFLNIITEDNNVCCELRWIEISKPVGSLPIRFKFKDGWVFVAERSPQLNKWLKENRRAGIIDRLEANVFAWLLAAVACLATIGGSYVYLLPWVSEKVANAVPDYIAVALGDEILEGFDGQWQASKLTELQQQQITTRLNQHIQQLDPLPYPVQLIFRSSDIGANAFALPGGKIVLLDQMVQLAKTPQQLDSIILHEVGHIHHRHMLKKLVHSSLLSVGVALLTGESSGIVDNLAGVGVFILSNGHSQDAETEADQFARQSMMAIYGSSEPMADMFRLFKQQGETDLPQWFRSHPDFDQRIESVTN